MTVSLVEVGQGRGERAPEMDPLQKEQVRVRRVDLVWGILPQTVNHIQEAQAEQVQRMSPEDSNKKSRGQRAQEKPCACCGTTGLHSIH